MASWRARRSSTPRFAKRRGSGAEVLLEGRAERSEVLVAYERGDVTDGIPAGGDQAPGLLEPPDLDVGMRGLARVVAEVPEQRGRAGKGQTRDRRQREPREEIGLDVAHGPTRHGVSRRLGHAAGGRLLRRPRAGQQLDQQLSLEERQRPYALAA